MRNPKKMVPTSQSHCEYRPSGSPKEHKTTAIGSENKLHLDAEAVPYWEEIHDKESHGNEEEELAQEQYDKSISARWTSPNSDNFPQKHVSGLLKAAWNNSVLSVNLNSNPLHLLRVRDQLKDTSSKCVRRSGIQFLIYVQLVVLVQLFSVNLQCVLLRYVPTLKRVFIDDIPTWLYISYLDWAVTASFFPLVFFALIFGRKWPYNGMLLVVLTALVGFETALELGEYWWGWIGLEALVLANVAWLVLFVETVLLYVGEKWTNWFFTINTFLTGLVCAVSGLLVWGLEMPAESLYAIPSSAVVVLLLLYSLYSVTELKSSEVVLASLFLLAPELLFCSSLCCCSTRKGDYLDITTRNEADINGDQVSREIARYNFSSGGSETSDMEEEQLNSGRLSEKAPLCTV